MKEMRWEERRCLSDCFDFLGLGLYPDQTLLEVTLRRLQWVACVSDRVPRFSARKVCLWAINQY